MIQLKAAETEDLFRISEMADDIWNAYYSEFLPAEQIRYMLGKFYSHESLIRQTEDGQRFYLIISDSEPIGFIALSKKSEGQYFIHKLYLYPSEQKQNAGSKVLALAGEIFSKEAGTLPWQCRLTVNRQNFKAINFYFKNGFRIESVADFDIGNGYYMNDFIMLKTAVHPR